MSNILKIILNPTAGKGAAAGKVPEIRRILVDMGIDFSLTLTEKPGHARALAAEAVKGADTVIVSAGGDGTANEIINGLMESGIEKPRFAVIPIGRGNDMAYGLGIDTDWRKAISDIAEGSECPMDVGRVRGGDYPDGLFFGNGIGVGFDAIVGFEAARMTRIHGAASYTLGALKTIITYPDAPFTEFTADGKKENLRPALISIMNGRRMGGSFFMAPDASINDGLLDWCHTDQGPRLRLLSALAAYAKGRHREREDTVSGRAAEFSIRAVKGSLAVHADGETVCESGSSIDIEAVPEALKLIGSTGRGPAC